MKSRGQAPRTEKGYVQPRPFDLRTDDIPHFMTSFPVKTALLFALVSFIQFGCWGNHAGSRIPLSPSSQLKTIDVKIDLINPYGTSIDPIDFPDELILSFVPIPGGIWGTSDSKYRSEVSVKKGGQLSVDLDRELSAFDRAAATFYDVENQIIEVDPETTRIARIGTSVLDPSSREQIAGSGFLDPTSGDFLMLVYVDRSCRISGTAESGGVHYDIDIRLDGEGFHLIRSHNMGERGRFLKEFPHNGQFEYVIIVENVLGA